MTERFEVRWADVAVTDLLAIVDYALERGGFDLAESLRERLIAAVLALETLPRRCRVVPELRARGLERYREQLVGPYRVMFSLHGEHVTVLACVDGRRDLEELLLERALRESPRPG